MKTFLDDPKNYNAHDPLEVYQTLSSFGEQFESAWHDAQFIKLDFEIEKIKNIVFAGMGGSILSAKIAQSLSPFLLKLPFEIVANYRLPAYVDKSTLVILASYSGNTEETLSCANDAKQHQSKVVVITSGGKLRDFSLTEHWPTLFLDEKLNRSHVPRFGLGLMLGATLGILTRLNQEAYRFLDPKKISQTIGHTFDLLNVNRPASDNPAKTLALKQKGFGLVIFAANHLVGVGKTAANFINETSKSFCTVFELPDLNHHLMEGLAFPTTFKDNTRFIFLNSDQYPDIIQKRFQITKDVLIKQKYQLTVIKPESTDPIAQTFESLVFLVMFSYYLSIVNKVNPGTNPWVDYFKNHLH